MISQLLRPGWIVTHLLVIALAVAFVSLGLWQVRRHGEQLVENERVAEQLAAPPVPLARALTEPDLDLLPATATGVYEPSGEVTLSPRSRNERPGFEVLTPLRIDGGRAVMVNRGWVPLDDPAPSAPRGEVELDGRLRAPREARQVLTDDAGAITLVSNVDLEELATQVPELVTEAYFEVVGTDASLAAAIPRPAAPAVQLDAGPHLSYAAQWFAFTAIGLVGYPLLLRRRLAEVGAETSK